MRRKLSSVGGGGGASLTCFSTHTPLPFSCATPTTNMVGQHQRYLNRIKCNKTRDQGPQKGKQVHRNFQHDRKKTAEEGLNPSKSPGSAIVMTLVYGRIIK